VKSPRVEGFRCLQCPKDCVLGAGRRLFLGFGVVEGPVLTCQQERLKQEGEMTQKSVQVVWRPDFLSPLTCSEVRTECGDLAERWGGVQECVTIMLHPHNLLLAARLTTLGFRVILDCRLQGTPQDVESALDIITGSPWSPWGVTLDFTPCLIDPSGGFDLGEFLDLVTSANTRLMESGIKVYGILSCPNRESDGVSFKSIKHAAEQSAIYAASGGLQGFFTHHRYGSDARAILREKELDIGALGVVPGWFGTAGEGECSPDDVLDDGMNMLVFDRAISTAHQRIPGIKHPADAVVPILEEVQRLVGESFKVPKQKQLDLATAAASAGGGELGVDPPPTPAA